MTKGLVKKLTHRAGLGLNNLTAQDYEKFGQRDLESIGQISLTLTTCVLIGQEEDG